MGLSYAEMSRQLKGVGREIPPLGLRRLEAGERRVDVDDLMAIAVVLDVAPLRLLMPPTASSVIDAEATGTGVHSTSELWNWAKGFWRPGDAGRASWRFRIRSSPRTVLSRSERIDSRKAWVDSRRLELEREVTLAELDLDHNDPAPGVMESILDRRHEIQILEMLDIEDDSAFDEIGEADPAPPSPEELAGLLREERDDE